MNERHDDCQHTCGMDSKILWIVLFQSSAGIGAQIGAILYSVLIY
jgi:hypothetical protein